MHLIRRWQVGGFALALLVATSSVAPTGASTRPRAKLEVLMCVGEEYPAGCGPRRVQGKTTWGNAGAEGAGTVSGGRIMCGGYSGGRLNTSCSADFPAAKEVTLRVRPAGYGDYVFHHWFLGRGKCNGKVCTVRVEVGRTVRVRAVFSRN